MVTGARQADLRRTLFQYSGSRRAPISTGHSDSRGASIEYLRGEADIGRAPPEYQYAGAKMGAAPYSGPAMRAEHAERIQVKEAEAHRA